VLGIPRGGVPVAFEIALRLGAPLDVLVVRKVGAPGDPEYGLGAVAEGGVVVLDEPRARAAGFSRGFLGPYVRREQEEVAARVQRFRGGHPPVELTGRTAIVVDDGVATGGTVEAAVTVVRSRGAASVIVALGVAPPEALTRLRTVADDVVVAVVPQRFEAVGQWYLDFDPVEDDEVARLLVRARGAGGPATAAGAQV
jgi:putative phosphoribosyl transferase